MGTLTSTANNNNKIINNLRIKAFPFSSTFSMSVCGVCVCVWESAEDGEKGATVGNLKIHSGIFSENLSFRNAFGIWQICIRKQCLCVCAHFISTYLIRLLRAAIRTSVRCTCTAFCTDFDMPWALRIHEILWTRLIDALCSYAIRNYQMKNLSWKSVKINDCYKYISAPSSVVAYKRNATARQTHIFISTRIQRIGKWTRRPRMMSLRVLDELEADLHSQFEWLLCVHAISHSIRIYSQDRDKENEKT